MKALLPQIHFVSTEKYDRKNSNMRKKIELLRSSTFKDDVKNPLLKTFEINKLKEEEKIKVISIIANEKKIFSDVFEEDEILMKRLLELGIDSIISLMIA